ncbi:hypothetical protein ACNR9V_20520 (plasmid) [Parageobacillus thermoglucosidasius]|uniref:hypothetical protein n=1 Tax=Parageobacillus thermoglucosidasius TaxID=1426 RepID=UPI003B68517D
MWQSVHVAGQGISHTARARHASHGPAERNEIGSAKHRVCEDGKSIAFSHDAVPLREKEFPLPTFRSAVADVLFIPDDYVVRRIRFRMRRYTPMKPALFSA